MSGIDSDLLGTDPGYGIEWDVPLPQRGDALALVLTGGGARAAYQVGVLRAIAALLERGAPSPFPIICGTSAGAINAAATAAGAGDFRRTVHQLAAVWKQFRAHHVYRADASGVMRTGGRWLGALLVGGRGRHNPASLLDNAPLAELLHAILDLHGVQASIDKGYLHALSVTASGYSSGESVSFCQGMRDVSGWRRARRVGLCCPIGIEHLMASAALPFIFPAVKLGGEYFGDGSMRQIAPLSPALHLGARRLLVVGTGRPSLAPLTQRSSQYPSLAQIAGHALNSIFLDSLETDLERLRRINHTIGLIPDAVRAQNNMALHRVEVLVMLPSISLADIAARYTQTLPRAIRVLFRGIGAMGPSGANLASYLLFEAPYTRALMRLGYEDAMKRRGELLDFIGLRRRRAH
jgi:NTE family protein